VTKSGPLWQVKLRPSGVSDPAARVGAAGAGSDRPSRLTLGGVQDLDTNGRAEPAVLLLSRLHARRVAEWACFLALAAVSAWSAMLVKETHSLPALAGVRLPSQPLPEPDPVRALGGEPAGSERAVDATPDRRLWAPAIRFFNGRPIRPARTVRMTVTAYSPDARSCGPWADGRTATLHSVNTNAHRLVAADPRVLPYGSMVTVPGYDEGRIVPVLDCGGKIKGNRLDVLYRTHSQAVRWGVQHLRVTVWEYADGKPAENPRRER